MFSSLSFPDPSVEFLYERSANMIDSNLYQHFNNSDTLNTEEWNVIYQEMYYASHDTSIQKPFDSIENEVSSYQNDTVNFGIMHWNLYRLKKVSLQSGNYFVFDTNNNRIYDHPSPVSTPYELDSLFLGSPLSSSAYFSSVTYRINPEFIFTDSKTLNDLKNNYTLQIDFGDGVGFRVIDPTIENFIPVTYSSSGEKVIKTALFPKAGIRSYIYSSVSRIYIMSDDIKPTPDYEITDIPGMTVGVYNSCQPSDESKKVIFVEGYDFTDFLPNGNRTHQELYNSFIRGEKIHHLQNYGYEYYVIDWDDSKQDMRFNAYNLVMLIEKLKQEQHNTGNNQEFVIIGESMGGVIARYVINYMESSDYQNDEYQEVFFVEENDVDSYPYIIANPGYKTEWQTYNNNKQRKHNTRLLITLDSPHQGANMPLAYQFMYRMVESKVLPPFVQKVMNKTFKFQLLDRKASRQLLKIWAPQIGFFNSPYIASYFSSEASHDAFFEQAKFENFGNPKYCKMVALSDGALDGSPQQNPVTYANRTGGDAFIDLDYSMDIVVIGIPINLATVDIELKSTPHQATRRIYKGRAGLLGLYLPKFKIFGVTIQKVYLPLHWKEIHVNNTDSYDVVAGGFINLNTIANGIRSVTNGDFFNTRKEIWGGLFGFYSQANFYSDGMSFCFVPLESALDYNEFDPSRNTDILNAPIDSKTSLTPFDVFTGFVDSTNLKNRSHTTVNNPYVYNLTQVDAQSSLGFSPDKYAYHTCADQNNHIPVRTFLSQEIGDEELYLENFETDRITSYRPEWDLYVNHRNPYYTYINQTPSYPTNILKNIYSKETDFNVVNSGVGNGYATFFYDNASGVSTMPGLNINYINSTQFTSANLPYGVCCATTRSSTSGSKMVDKNDLDATISVFPNPCSQSDILMIKASFPSGEEEVNVTLYDITGKVVFTLKATTIKETNNFEQPLNIGKLNLKNGIYLLKVNNDKHTLSEKLIIH